MYREVFYVVYFQEGIKEDSVSDKESHFTDLVVMYIYEVIYSLLYIAIYLSKQRKQLSA